MRNKIILFHNNKNKENIMKTNLLICTIILLVFLCNLGVASPATDYSFVREFGQAGTESNRFYKMDGIAVDRFGHVFVSDIYPDIFNYYTNNLVAIKRWSTVGQYELLWLTHWRDGMNLPAGIDCSCDGDPFYVAPLYLIHPYGRAIEHSSPDGAFFEIFPESSWSHDGFYFIDVAISGDGFAYGTFIKNMLNLGGEMPGVAKFSWNGTTWIPVAEILLTNLYDETSSDVHGIDVDPWRDRVYVTVLTPTSGVGVAAVKVYDMDLNHVQDMFLWQHDAMPYGIAVDNRNGAFFVCEAISNIVQKFDTSGTQVTSWGGLGSGESEFNRPTDLDVDMNGWVYVADADNHRVQVFAPPPDGNLNFIVFKSKVKVKWKQKAKGKNRDIIMAKGFVAVDHLTNIFGGPGSQAMVGLPISFWYGEVPIISNMPPTKTNPKGSKALYKPDKNHKAKLIYKEKGALIKFVAKLKKADVDGPLGIVDNAVLPPWLWVNAQMTLSTNYLGVHYMRLEHKNKVGKIYKAIKK